MPIIMIPKEYEDELQHGLFGTTKKRKGAKYIAKVPIGKGKYRYFYNKAEWIAYKATKAVGDAAETVADKVSDAANDAIDATGRKHYKKADKAKKEAQEAKKVQDASLKKMEKLEDKAFDRGMKSGAYGAQIYTDKERKEFDKTLKRYEDAGKKYIVKNREYKSNKKKGDDSAYGYLVKGKKKLAKLFG